MEGLVTAQLSPSSSSPRRGFSGFLRRKAVYLMVRYLSGGNYCWRLRNGVPLPCSSSVVKGSLPASRSINVLLDMKPGGVSEEYWFKLLALLYYVATQLYPPVDDPVEYLLSRYPGVPRRDVERAWHALNIAGLV